MPSATDITLILRAPRSDPVLLYDHIAPRYDTLHRKWLRAGGAEALAAVQGALAAELRPGLRVLDAGCGTGALGHWVAVQEPRVRLTLMDAAPAMLDQAAARVTEARHVHGSLLALPFNDASFDVVVCTWALETLDDPARAVTELERVLVPNGLLCCCFCSQPTHRWTLLRSLILRWIIATLFRGRFLPPGFPAGWHAGPTPRPRRLDCHGGLSTFLCHRKAVGDKTSGRS